VVKANTPTIGINSNAALGKARSVTLTHKAVMLINEHPLTIVAKSSGLQGPLVDSNAAATFDGIDKEVRNGNHE
jgi:hypothetical protein